MRAVAAHVNDMFFSLQSKRSNNQGSRRQQEKKREIVEKNCEWFAYIIDMDGWCFPLLRLVIHRVKFT